MKYKYYTLFAGLMAMTMAVSPMTVMASESTEAEIVTETETESETAADTEEAFDVTYTVTDADGTVVNDYLVMDVAPGELTPAYSGPLYIGENYVFQGWDPVVEETVQADANYQAVWSEVENPDKVHKLTADFHALGEDGSVSDELGGTFDVYVNGILWMDNVAECEVMLPADATYSIRDVQPAEELERKDTLGDVIENTITEDMTLMLVSGTADQEYVPNETELPTESETQTETSTEETEVPTEEETETSSVTPTEAPTEAPTETPTEAPSQEPTETPTETPTEAPSEEPAEATYTITFDSQGGSEVPSQTLTEGETVELSVPTKEGYTFDGWYTDAEAGVKVDAMVATQDVTLYAHWLEAVGTEFTITFDTQGGDPIEPMVVQSGMTVTLPEASRDGYVFDGWYTEAEAGEKVDTLTVDADMTVYAHWTEADGQETMYTITYQDGADGTIFEDVVYSVKENDPTPVFGENDPVRDGYTFDGWNPEVQETVTADATYTAKWIEAEAFENTGKTDTVAESVRTGDLNIMLIFGIGAAAIAVLAGVFVYVKKFHK